MMGAVIDASAHVALRKGRSRFNNKWGIEEREGGRKYL
jgi:hypothetical protein